MSIDGKDYPKEYLGDGVYGLYDGFGIWLHANDHRNPTDKIYIEPSVMKNLKMFEKKCDDFMSASIEKENKDYRDSSDDKKVVSDSSGL